MVIGTGARSAQGCPNVLRKQYRLVGTVAMSGHWGKAEVTSKRRHFRV
jgi:hypothetical protein